MKFLWKPKREVCQHDTFLLLKKKAAFTLAEVLITLSILGIVAAIAIPNVVNNFQKRMWVTGLQRWYSDMQNTIDEFVVYNNNKMETFDVSIGSFNLRNTNFVKFLDDKYGDLYINIEDNQSSWGTRTKSLIKNKNNTYDYTTLNNVKPTNPYPDLYVSIYSYKTYNTKYKATFHVYFSKIPVGLKGWIIIVDTNGSKHSPNKAGRDVFHFYINNLNVLTPRQYANPYFFYSPTGSSAEGTYDIGCSMSSTNNLNGTICAKKIIQDGWKMNY